MIIIEKSKYRVEKLKKDGFITFLYNQDINNRNLYGYIVPLLDFNGKPYFILSNGNIEGNGNFGFRTKKYEKDNAIEFLDGIDLSSLSFIER